jgi:hypothetical protein
MEPGYNGKTPFAENYYNPENTDFKYLYGTELA